ncbi:MAG TPA: SRPBCC family protein [Acidimicrobiales bacterium]
MNETLTTEGGRTVLRMERRFAHPVDKVWRALSEPDELVHWFPSKVELDPAVGGKVRFIEEGDEYPSLDGEITDLDPPRLIAYTWDDDHLRWELRPDGDGCVLTLTHTFGDRYGAGSFATGWTVCIDALGARLAGEPPPEHVGSLDVFADLHERFVERFGLTEPMVRRTGEGWSVRIERQLVGPIDAVWRALAGGAEVTVASRPPSGLTTPAFPAGPVVTTDPPALVAYRWPPTGDPAGTVRWELSPGAGGARLIVTVTVPTALADQRAIAGATWRARVEEVARQVRELPA